MGMERPLLRSYARAVTNYLDARDLYRRLRLLTRAPGHWQKWRGHTLLQNTWRMTRLQQGAVRNVLVMCGRRIQIDVDQKPVAYVR